MSRFVGYPADPSMIGDSFEVAAKSFNASHMIHDHVRTWPQIFELGAFIDQNVLQNIDDAERSLFDVTIGNFNVYFEIGYAIGRNKPVTLLINDGLNNGGKYLDELGLFDTIGYARYSNSTDLYNIFGDQKKTHTLFSGEKVTNRSQPLYLLDSLIRTEFAARMISAVKESKTFFRSFDPKEEYRMSLRRELIQVSSSTGVIVSVLDESIKDSENHNLRAAFLAGLAHGMEVEYIVIAMAQTRTAIDVRDFVKRVHRPEQIAEIVIPFCSDAMAQLQYIEGTQSLMPRGKLSQVSLGASAAENEYRRLSDYFVTTTAFRSALEGKGRIIVGRKGSGKTAIFWQLRDRLRSSNRNLVLDLKPDGYQLIKFKDVLLSQLTDGTKEHTVAAFWEYALYLEMCYKIIENDSRLMGRNATVTSQLPLLKDIYFQGDSDTEGDFSERINRLLSDISTRFKLKTDFINQQRLLSSQELTEIIYQHDMRKLKERVCEYLKTKHLVVILIDNLDKGWDAKGVSTDDTLVIRTLLEAVRKIERALDRENIEFHGHIFLRNDVYELLVDATPDRGKEGKVVIDWGNREALKSIIYERIRASTSATLTPALLWKDVFSSNVFDQDSLDWVLDRSLMRPRYLIDLVDRCLGHAITTGKDLVDQESFIEGYRTYSLDVLASTNFEMRDVKPSSFQAVFSLRNKNSRLLLQDIKLALMQDDFPEDDLLAIIDMFVWFGVLGVITPKSEARYIFDVEYNNNVLARLRQRDLGDHERFEINRAFWAALDITPMLEPDSAQLVLLG